VPTDLDPAEIRERDAIGIMICRKPLRDLAGHSVHHREPIADVLDDIKVFSVGRERQSRRIACARTFAIPKWASRKLAGLVRKSAEIAS